MFQGQRRSYVGLDGHRMQKEINLALNPLGNFVEKYKKIFLPKENYCPEIPFFSLFFSFWIEL